VAILWELGHVQEALDQLDKATGDPATLPEATEQVGNTQYIYYSYALYSR
jgi:hypothetical protein